MAAISAEDYDWGLPEQFNFTRDVVEELATDPNRRALTFVDDSRVLQQYTFAQLAAEAARWAHVLRGAKNCPRDGRVLVLMGKVPAWAGVMLGALKGGLVAVPCPEQLRARDLAFRARHCGASLLVADRRTQDEVDGMQGLLDRPLDVLYLDEAELLLQRHATRAPTEDTRWYEDAFVLYTSGTTREPKGVTHTHAYAFSKRMQAEHWLGARPGDVVWCTAGTGWAKSIWNVLLGPWSRGAEIILHEGAFDPDDRLDLIDRLGVTILCQAPTEYRLLAKLDGLERYPLARLRHAVSAGEPLNPQAIERFRDAFQLTVHDGYGQTENTLLVANTLGVEVRPGSMGMPTPGHHMAVIDEDGREVEPGVEGDIALLGRPPSLFDRYWDAPEETAAVFKGQWYVTGDRATCDDDGYFWFAGRADDVILSAAYRIGPFEVESALLEHEAVAESAVVGKPDSDRGQIVKAFVVLRAGHESNPDLVHELQEHAKRVTAPYKYPREIEFVSELPKTRSGKIRRGELRALEERRAQEHAPLRMEAPAALAPLGPVPAAAAEERRDEPEFLTIAERRAFEAERKQREQQQRRESRPARTQETPDAGEAEAAKEAAEQRAGDEARELEKRRRAEERQLERAEAERLEKEAEARQRKQAEAERLEKEAEARQRKQAEAERRAAEAEARRRKRAEAERSAAEAEARERKQAEAERRAADAEARKREQAETERRKKEAEARSRKQAEAERRAAEAEARQREQAEAERSAAEAEARKREAKRRAAEAEARKRKQAEAERSAAEAEARKREQAEVERRASEAEATRRKQAEDERREKEAEARRRKQAEAQRRAAETEARMREEAEAERLEKEVETRKREQAEEERRAAEAEARKREQAEQERSAAEAKARQRERVEAERRAAEAEASLVSESQPRRRGRRARADEEADPLVVARLGEYGMRHPIKGEPATKPPAPKALASPKLPSTAKPAARKTPAARKRDDEASPSGE